MRNLTRHLGGPTLWVKREDCTGLGFGGNKLRKLDTVLRGVWQQERNIADEAVLAQMLAERELPAGLIEASHSQAVHERYEQQTQQAIDAGVFGAPSYVVDGEIFWGQDRLDFLERKLAPAR